MSSFSEPAFRLSWPTHFERAIRFVSWSFGQPRATVPVFQPSKASGAAMRALGALARKEVKAQGLNRTGTGTGTGGPGEYGDGP